MSEPVVRVGREDPRTREQALAAAAPQVSTRKVVLVGIGLWCVALAVLLAVPSFHSGGRAWWPWVAVAGVVLGVIGYVYLRRGRGNAADAD